MANIAIIDYGSGNLHSVVHAFERLSHSPRIVRDPGELAGADAYVLPGVGAFGTAMAQLTARRLIEPLREQVLEHRRPFLGICLGMQLLAEDSTEAGLHQGLGWLKGAHVVDVPHTGGVRVPHVGWNDVSVARRAPLFEALDEQPNFYFDHSYHLVCDAADVAASFNYGQTMVAAIQRDNLFAVQFHPERSQTNGLKLLRRFVDYVVRQRQAAA